MEMVNYQHIYNPNRGGQVTAGEWEAFKNKFPRWKLYWKVVEGVTVEPIEIAMPAEAVEAVKKRKNKDATLESEATLEE